LILTPHPTFRFGRNRGPNRHPVRLAALLQGIDVRYTYNGRAALYQLMRRIAAARTGAVLVPSFHCMVLVDPIVHAGLDVRYYRVDSKLRIDLDDLRRRLMPDVAAVVAINYFGFPTNLLEVRKACRETGACLVEDCSHSFLYTDPFMLAGERGDASLYSFWKLVPSDVGGGVRFNDPALGFEPEVRRVQLNESLRRAKRLFEQALAGAEGDRMARWYRTVERQRAVVKRVSTPSLRQGESESTERKTAFEYPFDPRLARTAMPWMSKAIIEAADLATIARRRRQNFEVAGDRLRDVPGVEPLYRELPDRVCPWCFPVKMDRRRDLDHRLHALGVPLYTFGETLHRTFWEQAKEDPLLLEPARSLSRDLLCLAIHQNLALDDVNRFCSIVTDFLSASSSGRACPVNSRGGAREQVGR